MGTEQPGSYLALTPLPTVQQQLQSYKQLRMLEQAPACWKRQSLYAVRWAFGEEDWRGWTGKFCWVSRRKRKFMSSGRRDREVRERTRKLPAYAEEKHTERLKPSMSSACPLWPQSSCRPPNPPTVTLHSSCIFSLPLCCKSSWQLCPHFLCLHDFRMYWRKYTVYFFELGLPLKPAACRWRHSVCC